MLSLFTRAFAYNPLNGWKSMLSDFHHSGSDIGGWAIRLDSTD
jgi:hypothetical protein